MTDFQTPPTVPVPAGATPTPFKVGDRIRVLRGERVGRTGIVASIEGTWHNVRLERSETGEPVAVEMFKPDEIRLYNITDDIMNDLQDRIAALTAALEEAIGERDAFQAEATRAKFEAERAKTEVEKLKNTPRAYSEYDAIRDENKRLKTQLEQAQASAQQPAGKPNAQKTRTETRIITDATPAALDELLNTGWEILHMQFESGVLRVVARHEVPADTAPTPTTARVGVPVQPIRPPGHPHPPAHCD